MHQLKDQRGMALIFEIVLVAFVLVVVGLAVFSSYSRKAGISPTPTPSITPTPSASATAAEGYSLYTSSHEPGLSFQYPSSWKAVPSQIPGGDGANITSPSGTIIWWSSANTAVPTPGCPGNERIAATFSAALPSAAGLNLVQYDVTNYAGTRTLMGVTSGPMPAPGTIMACPYLPVFQSHSDANHNLLFGSNGPVQPQDNPAARQILESLKY
jgi:hypothetical protein